jgi:hypothetical protein
MQRRLKIGVLYSRVRVEEKWIFNALEKRGVDFDRLDDRAIHFDLENPAPWQEYDAVIERSISYNSGVGSVGRTWVSRGGQAGGWVMGTIVGEGQ